MDAFALSVLAVICAGVIAAVIYTGIADRRKDSKKAGDGTPQSEPEIVTPPSPSAATRVVSASKPLTAGALFWVIFGAMWAFAISSAVIYLIFHSLIAAAS